MALMQVTRAQGEAIASQWRCKFFETSAKSKINNEECFAEVTACTWLSNCALEFILF